MKLAADTMALCSHTIWVAFEMCKHFRTAILPGSENANYAARIQKCEYRDNGSVEIYSDVEVTGI